MVFESTGPGGSWREYGGGCCGRGQPCIPFSEWRSERFEPLGLLLWVFVLMLGCTLGVALVDPKNAFSCQFPFPVHPFCLVFGVGSQLLSSPTFFFLVPVYRVSRERRLAASFWVACNLGQQPLFSLKPCWRGSIGMLLGFTVRSLWRSS